MADCIYTLDDIEDHVEGMNALKDGWFTENDLMFTGFTPSIKVDNVLVDETTKYQKILLFKSKKLGKVLVLDNAIQLSEFDEFSYQEMISFLPLNSHTNPQDVLIIGGGDGGVAREVVKHPNVTNVTQCEIDAVRVIKRVVEVSKKHLPFMAAGFDDPKMKLHIGDGHEFMGKHKQSFDVIITDSSDPIGPAELLFHKSYYELMKAALKPGGIVCCQGESMWFSLDLVKKMVTFCRTLFPVVAYAYTTIPTYPGGHIGFLLCSLNPDMSFSEPFIKFSDGDVKSMKLKYYNTKLHQASFVLPTFVAEALQEVPDAADNDSKVNDR